MTHQESLLALVQSTLDECYKPSVPLSVILQKAIRVANIRNDYENLWWLKYELIPFHDKEARRRVVWEIVPHYDEEKFKRHQSKITQIWRDERLIKVKFDESGLLRENIASPQQLNAKSVFELEKDIECLQKRYGNMTPPPGLHPVDLYSLQQDYDRLRDVIGTLIKEYEGILLMIRNRVHEYLSTAEKQLMFGQMNADIFEKNRQFVEVKLGQIAPEALEQVTSAYKRLSEGDVEARSQALLACRRLLKSLADQLYPPPNEPIMGPDGKVREFTDEKFISRLWQFVNERTPKTRAGELLKVQINSVGERIDAIYNFSNKGVHANITEPEAEQCVIQTYLLTGDLLRLAENDSALSIGDEELERIQFPIEDGK